MTKSADKNSAYLSKPHSPVLIPQPGVNLLSTSQLHFSCLFRPSTTPSRGKDYYSDTSTHPSGKLFSKPAFKVFLSWLPLSSLNLHVPLASQLCSYMGCNWLPQKSPGKCGAGADTVEELKALCKHLILSDPYESKCYYL